MMSDFEAETRHKNFLNGIRNKWRAASSKFKEKVKNIKIAAEKANNKKQKDYKKRYKAKDLAIKNQLELNKAAKNEKKIKELNILERRMKMLEKIWNYIKDK